MSRFLLILTFVTLSACSGRAVLVKAPDLVSMNDIRSVFIGTTRAIEGGRLTGERSERMTLGRFDISIPPDREPGTVSWPEREVDPNTQFLLKDAVTYRSASAFRSELSRALSRRTTGSREAVIFVHGFNNTFEEGLLRITQLAHDFDLPGVAVHYSWPSAGNPLGYAYDRDSSLFARDGLEHLIAEVKAAGARQIVIVAHSMGSMLVMETLRQKEIGKPGSVLRDIDGVILISPDIDVDLFRAQVKRIGKLPEAFGIFVSKRDRVLNLSARLTGQKDRLGNVASVEEVSDLAVTIIDVTEFSTGAGHFTAATSPAVLAIFGRAGDLSAAFRGDRAGRTGLIPGTVLTVQNATTIILSPVVGLAGAITP